MWVLVLWIVLGTLLAVAVGRVIRAADQRERGEDGSAGDDEPAPPGERRAG
jgi:hypothetical protein